VATTEKQQCSLHTTAADVNLEMQGMSFVATDAEPWMTRLKGPHPAHVARAAGALTVVAGGRLAGYMAAYTLNDAGLLAESSTDQCKAPRPGNLLDRFGAVSLADRGFASRCWLCGQLATGHPSPLAAWDYLVRHWDTAGACTPTTVAELRAEVARLARELEEARSKASNASGRAQDLGGQVAHLRAKVEQDTAFLSYLEPADPTPSSCPQCSAASWRPHSEDCPALLGDVTTEAAW
jgi:hypothetical protein